jgi:DNA-binding GntR family transcriptional regulator
VSRGEKLPAGSKLAETYGVARQTVQNALDIPRDEKLIVSRQGSGVFVRERTKKRWSAPAPGAGLRRRHSPS